MLWRMLTENKTEGLCLIWEWWETQEISFLGNSVIFNSPIFYKNKYGSAY